MRRNFASIVVLLALVLPAVFVRPVHSQGFNPAQAPPWVFADNFGRWVLPGQVPNTYTFQVSGFSPCQITKLNFGDSATFYAFAATDGLAPVFIRDTNAANSEVVTPGTYLAPTAESCGPALAPVNNHTTFWLQSGTGGLQEAINSVGSATAQYPTVIYLTPEWYKLVSQISSQNSTLAAITPATIKAAAKGSVTAIVTDITTAPPTQYVWTGSGGYVSGTQYWVLGAHPTIAAGAGAGTSPTIAVTGNSVTGTVTLTTGSAVPAAADPIFTLTWPSPGTASAPTSGWQYAPSCTFTSTGTAPGVTTNSAVIGPPSVATLTSPAAGLASSTAGYAWTYLCK
ncbi:MAG TPA: hypothetical protein VMQ76_13440 [Terracidiphilus sp.]|jgi:hypothetical protein|nr:hypothetical protein [Terracidiphilus sp.]